MKLKMLLPALVVAAAVLHGCDSDDGATITGGRPDASRPASSAQIDVFNDNIASALAAPKAAATDSVNLFTNGGFEQGSTDWIACNAGGVSDSNDAYEGNGALELRSGNCVYRSVQVKPGLPYNLSCFIKLTTERAWTGMGMVFADNKFKSLLQAPTAVATSGKYMRLDTHGVAPQGTTQVSMFIHSDHGAVVDSCSLTLQANQTPRPVSNDANLLSNGTFSLSDGQGGASDWTAGCGGSVVSNGSSLFLADGACVDQALTAEAIVAARNSKVTLSCLVTEIDGYSDLSVFLDSKLQGFQRIRPSDKNTRVALEVNASAVGNGFVSLYSEGHLGIEGCQLVSDNFVANNAPVNNAPVNNAPVDNGTATGGAGNVGTDQGTVTDTNTDEPKFTDNGANGNTGTDTNTGTNTGTTTDTDTDTDTEAALAVQSARYRLTFNATWSQQTHPVSFPPPAHFSGLVGAVHSDAVEFWAPGQRATGGIQLMAETGNGADLLTEVAAAVANGSAKAEIAGGGVAASPGNVSVEFEVTRQHSLITVTSMVAPSPDWFVGVHGLPLFDGTNFVDTVTQNLPAYDSGTDSGVSFRSANLVTQPQGVIGLVNSAAADSNLRNGTPSMGQFVIEKLSESAAPVAQVPVTQVPVTPAPAAETSARYRLTFDAAWSQATHPVNFPPPAHFSGLVGAVHNSSVALWTPGQLASPGIKLMAETGNGSELLTEVAGAVANGSAAAEIAGGGVAVSPGNVSIEFEVTREHPLISVTSMVAPSPDWFVGVHGLSLFDGTKFVESLTQNLSVYDSGTDSGVSFRSDDLVSQPPAPISRVTSAAGDSDLRNGLPSMGRFIIQKLP